MPSTNIEFPLQEQETGLHEKKGLHLFCFSLQVEMITGRETDAAFVTCKILVMYLLYTQILQITIYSSCEDPSQSVSCSQTKSNQLHLQVGAPFAQSISQLCSSLGNHTGAFRCFTPLTTNCIYSYCCPLSKECNICL